jgi:mannosyltransferase
MNGELSRTRRPASIPGLGLLQSRSVRLAVGLLAVLAVALAVRLFGLTYHSLWFDEAMSTYWAARPAGQIWQVGMTLVQDKHPPLYYLLLHFWTALFGPGDLAVRTLGVLIGALAVLPAFGIGVSLGGWRAGALGALFVAINPFLVWYSQEARMFMPATTFILVGLYGALLIWDARPRRSSERLTGPGVAVAQQVAIRPMAVGVALVVVGFTAALYSYLLSVLILPVAVAWLLLLWRRSVRLDGQGARTIPSLVASLAALVFVAVLFLPLARAAWSVSGQESLPGRAFEGLVPALRRLSAVYWFGWPSWPAPAMTGIAAGAVALTLVGLVVPIGREPPAASRADIIARGAVGDEGVPVAVGRWGGALLAFWLGLPLVIGGLLLARDRTMFAETRYFIFLAPALCLAWGRALTWLWGRWRLAGLVGLALACGITLAALPADWSAQNRREAWRETAALIESQAGPNDAVLVQPDYVAPALTRYLPVSRQIYYPFTDRLDDPVEVDAVLQGLRDYDAIWLVQSHHRELDPADLVADWFGARYPLITEAYPAGIALHAFAQRYRSPALPGVPAGVPMVNKDFGSLRMLGCVAQPASLNARDDLYHPPSGWVHVTTYWTATAPLGEDVYPLVRLVDSAGQVWGERLERLGDAIHLWPTSGWQPGEVVRADYDVNLNPITPAGEYKVVVSVPGSRAQAPCGDVTVIE